jgi:hypothetical protein
MKRPMKHPWTSLHATVHQTLRDRNRLRAKTVAPDDLSEI